MSQSHVMRCMSHVCEHRLGVCVVRNKHYKSIDGMVEYLMTSVVFNYTPNSEDAPILLLNHDLLSHVHSFRQTKPV